MFYPAQPFHQGWVFLCLRPASPGQYCSQADQIMEKMWSFKRANFTITWYIEEDDLDTSYMDRDLARKCREKVSSGESQCFSSIFEVKHNATGLVLAESYLGNSIYEDPKDFRNHFGMNAKGHGSYFSDYIREAIRDARERFPVLQAQIARPKLRSPAPALETV